MAVVNSNKKVQQVKQQAAAGSVINGKQQGYKQQNPYAGMVGVSGNTAQHVGQLQQGYQQGQNVTQMQNVWNQIQGQRPGEYQSKYDGIIQGILQQIQNPKDFKYEINGDNLFKGYADLYTQKAKQGMQDAMGQAAALTGGYGNSYAQMVGQQQFQQNMLPLYEKALELRDRAYQEHQDQHNRLLDQYNVISQQEGQDYNRYQDAVQNWRQDESTAYQHMQDAQNMDYQMYQNDLNYWTGLAQVENQAYQTEAQRQDALEQYKQQYAWSQCQQILANGHMPSDALLAAAGLSREDAQAMMYVMPEPEVSGGGGGGGGSKVNQQIGNMGSTIAGAMSGAAAGVGNIAQNMLGGLQQTHETGHTTGGTTPMIKNQEEYLKKIRELANSLK